MVETGAATENSPAHIRAFLIADIRGYTRYTAQHGDEAAARLAAEFAVLCRETVTAHFGDVIELRGDEALAAFASSRHALRAAIDLQNRIGTHENLATQGVGIGLDAGEAIPVESGFRGAALNRAARLCSVAKTTEILVSDGLLHLAGRMEGVSYLERGSLPLKGFDEPVKAFSVRSALPTFESPDHDSSSLVNPDSPAKPRLPVGGFLGARPSTVLVGRGDEVTRAWSHVDAVLGGSGRVVTLVGEPGIGKTRLAQELTLHLQDRGFLITFGTCYETRENAPFHLFLDVVSGLYAGASPEVRLQIPTHFPYLRKLLPVEIQPSMPEPPADRDEHDWLFWSFTNFLQTLSEDSPVAILLDDLHWADNSSLELLQHLARNTRGNRILILATYRDVEVNRLHPLGRTLHALHREGLLDDVHLRRLTEDGTAALAASTFREEKVSDEFAALLHRYTDGNPFFTQEVLRTLVERGDLIQRDGGWDRKALEDIEVPRSVREAVGERLSRLPESSQDVLRMASVLGQRFHVDDLITMSALGENAVEAALEAATESQLVQAVDPDTNVFTHALIRQTLYSELSPRRQRRLHQAAGLAIEGLPDRKRVTRASELARHFFRADDPDRAMRWALVAGDQAEAVFAHGDAEAQYRLALDLAGELQAHQKEGEAAEKLGAVLSLLGRFTDALDTLEVAERAYVRLGDIDGRLRVAAYKGRAYANTGNSSLGIEYVEGLLKSLGDASPSRALAMAHTALAGMFFGSGNYAEQLTVAQRAGELARQIGDDAVLVDADALRAQALGVLQGSAAARSVYESILPLAERVADISTLHRIVNNLAFGYFFAGDFERNVSHRLRALELAEHQGDVGRIAFALAMVAQGMHFVGRWREALSFAKRALDASSKLGDAWNVTYVHAELGFILVYFGKFDDAKPHLDRAQEIAERNNDLQALIFVAEAESLLLLWQGDPDGALDIINRQLERLGPQDANRAWLTWILAMSELSRGNVDTAYEVITAHLEQGRNVGDNWSVMEGLRVLGQVLAARERWDQAEESFAEAIRLTAAAPYPFAHALTLLERGRMRCRRGLTDEGRTDLTQALVLMRQLDAHRHVRILEEISRLEGTRPMP